MALHPNHMRLEFLDHVADLFNLSIKEEIVPWKRFNNCTAVQRNLACEVDSTNLEQGCVTRLDTSRHGFRHLGTLPQVFPNTLLGTCPMLLLPSLRQRR